MKGSTYSEALEKHGKEKLCNDASWLTMPHFPGIDTGDILCQQFKGHVETGKLRSNRQHCWKEIIGGKLVRVYWEPTPGRQSETSKQLIQNGVPLP